MRTENQIKRKMHELTMQKQAVVRRMQENEQQSTQLAGQLERLEDQLLLLEWVLNEPTGSYHAHV